MSFPTWSWSPPHITSESGKETDDDLAVSSSPAAVCALPPAVSDSSGGLSVFLSSILPAVAIRSFAEQCARRSAAREARQFRRKLPTQTEQRLTDFADWSAALSDNYEATLCSGRVSASAHLTEVEHLTEVFYARWLRLQTRCPRHNVLALPFTVAEESRQRRCCHQTSQKKLKWSFLRDTKITTPQPTTNTIIHAVASVTSSHQENALPASIGASHSMVEDALGGTTKILCHASTYLYPNVWVYGGLTAGGCSGGLWSLDLSSGHTWQRTLSEQPQPSPRYNHTLIGWDHYLVLFGGDRGPGHTDDLWYFDTNTHLWDRISLEVEQRGLRPGARAGHSAVLYKNQMIIFGGWRGSDGFSDVWSWDLIKRHWRLVSPHTASRDVTKDEGLSQEHEGSRAPQARHWHVAAVFGDFMYIHGGFGPWGPLAQVWKLDLEGSRGWSHVPTTGRIPQARCRHSGAAIGDDRWAIIGGKDALGSYFDDLHILSTSKRVWQKVVLFTPPHPLATSDFQWWNCHQTVRQLPSLHCHSVCYDSNTNTIVLTGGCDGDCTARDSTILLKRSPTATLLFEEWQKRRPRGTTLPDFIAMHPTPYSQEICKFL